MKFQLGHTTVEAISDGGISVYPVKGAKCSYPILCIEVFSSWFPMIYARLSGKNIENATVNQQSIIMLRKYLLRCLK